MLENFAGVPDVVKEIYKDLAQPSFQKIGKALGTVFDVPNTILTPLERWNEKSKRKLAVSLKKYEDKLADIPEDEVIPVPNEIGVPVLERLAYSNEELSELFLNLLRSASSSKLLKNAHPSFVSCIQNLSTDEARILSHLKLRQTIINVRFYLLNKKTNYQRFISEYVSGLEHEVDLAFPENVPTYFENFIGMGFYKHFTEAKTVNDDEYEALVKKYNYDMSGYPNRGDYQDQIFFKHAYYELTGYGKMFIKACIKER
jgi:hypothetical protein